MLSHTDTHTHTVLLGEEDGGRAPALWHGVSGRVCGRARQGVVHGTVGAVGGGLNVFVEAMLLSAKKSNSIFVRWGYKTRLRAGVLLTAKERFREELGGAREFPRFVL